MLRMLRALARQHSIIFVGYSFSDGVVLDLLDQIAEEAPSGKTRRMFAVDPTISDSTAEYLRSKNIVAIPVTMSAFFDAIAARLDAEARKQCLARRINGVAGTDGVVVDLSPRQLVALGDQVEQLGPAVHSPSDARRFLSGQPPMAGDLKSHNDVERESETALTVLVRSYLADSTYLRPLIAVLGSGGAGKTTIASRVGHDLAESREAVVFRLKSEELWNRDDLIELTKKCNAPVVFVVDGLEVHSRFKAVKELRHDLSVARARALILVSC